MGAVISIIFGFIELLVGLRFVFLLLGANPATAIVSWVYSWSAPFIAPFAGILGQPTTAPSGAVVQGVFEPSSLIALIIYAAVGGILFRLFGMPRAV
jgi:hypothetical protein